MKYILIDPTCLSFTLNTNISGADELVQFNTFYKQLDQMLDDIKKANLKIGMSKKLYHLYLSLMPISVEKKHPIYKLAREAIQNKFKNLIKITPNFDISIEIDMSTVKHPNNITSLEVYQQWAVDHLSLISIKYLPSWCLTNVNYSISKYDYFYIIEPDKSKTIVYLANNIHQIKDSLEYSIYSLRKFSNNSLSTKINGVINNQNIKQMDDILDSQRSLFEKLVQTQLISSIQFIDYFYQNTSNCSTPHLIIKDIVSDGMSDYLNCCLVSNEVTMNGQSIEVQLAQGAGSKLAGLFNNEINSSNLDLLIPITTSPYQYS